MAAGYSTTPLAKKLGLAPGMRVIAPGAPGHYRGLLEPLPSGIRFGSRVDGSVDLVHLFTTDRATLTRALTKWRQALKPDAIIWVSWPKKSSKVPTSVTEDTIREVALPLGFVDIKVCAVDDTWSGLKLVVRKALR